MEDDDRFDLGHLIQIPDGKDIVIPMPSVDDRDPQPLRFIRWKATNRSHLKAFKVPIVPIRRGT